MIVVTRHEDYTIGTEAFSLGVRDFLVKDEISSRDIARSINFIKYYELNKKIRT
jgi:PleD family two-component response regulator